MEAGAFCVSPAGAFAGGWALRARQAQGDRRSRKSSHRRRGDKRFRTTAGDCTGDKVAKWYVDCDGGGVTIENGPEKRGLRVLLQGEGIAFGNDCDTTRRTFVGPGADDKILDLEPAPLSECAYLEKRTGP